MLVKVGNVFFVDLFYIFEFEIFEKMKKFGILGVDMEVVGIYGVVVDFGVCVLMILMVLDYILCGEKFSLEDC